MEADLVVEVVAAPADADLAADEMWQAGATAVGLRDDGAVTVVTASFPTPGAARQVAGELAGRGARLVEVDPAWRHTWREFAQPVAVGEGLVVAPAWRDVAVGTGRTVLRIDPGDCFGSGSHPSTRLVLTALDRRPPAAGDAVVDLGCGSGILAVAAARLGAGRVTAVDIDPAAVAVTAANAAANGVAGRVAASTTPAGDLTGQYAVALVNVTAAVHAVLGPDAVRLVPPGGRIVVAGLLPGQWRHVAGAYAGVAAVSPLELDGWEGAELTVAG
ncbi:MAG TPA: 50S ribosomal protein L11 methyltransferase [Acidimicrobiales bacterium]|nr:50S ribosomal protein L11 methyltransferase [Acidimicrobiales bacterium]